MKKGIFLTAALAMVLGVGVAVGAHQQFKEAKAYQYSGADCGTTWYVVGTINGQNWNQWNQLQLNGNRYEYTFEDASQVEFKLKNANNWDDGFEVYAYHSDMDLSKGWSSLTNNNGGNFQTKAAGKYTVYFDKNITSYENGMWAFGIEEYQEPEPEKDDPSAETNLFYVYDKDEALGTTLENVKVYGFGQASNIKEMEWPGTHDGVTTSVQVGGTLYRVELSTSYPNFIMNGNGHQTVDVTNLGDHLGDVAVIGAADEVTGKYAVTWEELSEFNDIPAEEGYYLVSSKGDFKYNAATKMTQVDPLVTGNVATLTYTAEPDEKIKVRSFFVVEEVKQDKWSMNIDGTKSYGEQDGEGNFVFAHELDETEYDIYALYDGDDFKFSVAPHAEKILVTLAAKMYDGSHAQGEVTIGQYEVVKGQPYSVPAIARDGYVQQKTYTDFACTNEFTNGTVLEYNTMLHVKYMQIGYYVISDAGSWSIDNATLMLTSGINPNNKAEALITVASENETYSFVYFDENGSMSGHAGLGDTYGFVEDEEDHIKFTATGTYAVYWSNANNKLYVNAGLTAFCTNFLSEVGGVCTTDNTTDLDELKAVWGELKKAYNLLDDDTEKSVLIAIGFNGGNPEGELEYQVIASYHYIVTKYGTDVAEDFIWGEKYTGTYHAADFALIDNSENVNNLIVVIAVISATAVAGTAVLLVLKKRKHN